MNKEKILAELGITDACSGASTGTKWFASGKAKALVSYSPIDDKPIGTVRCADRDDYEKVAAAADAAL